MDRGKEDQLIDDVKLIAGQKLLEAQHMLLGARFDRFADQGRGGGLFFAPARTTSRTLSNSESLRNHKPREEYTPFFSHPSYAFAARLTSAGQPKAASPTAGGAGASRHGFFAHRLELQLVGFAVHVDAHMLAVLHFAVQDLDGQRVLNHALQGTLQGARTVGRIGS